MIKKIQIKETTEKEVITCDWCQGSIPYRGHGFTCLSCGRITCSECYAEKSQFKCFDDNYGQNLSSMGQVQHRQRACFCTECIGRGRDKLILAMFKDEENEAWITEQFREYRRRQIRDKINREICRREKRFGMD